jgi:hypothetical protein
MVEKCSSTDLHSQSRSGLLMGQVGYHSQESRSPARKAQPRVAEKMAQAAAAIFTVPSSENLDHRITGDPSLKQSQVL